MPGAPILRGNTGFFYNTEYDIGSQTTALYPYVLPVYKITQGGDSTIDGFTGEPSSYEGDRWQSEQCYLDSWGRYSDPVYICGGYDSWDGGEITDIDENDIALYEKTHDSSKYITSRKAEEILRADGMIVFDSGLALTDEKITYDRDGNGAVRALLSVRFEYDPKERPGDETFLSANLDAFSGEIVSFGKYYNGESGEAADEKTARGAAQKAAAHFMGGKAAEYRFEKMTERDSANSEKGTAVLMRYVNGLPAKFDKAYVRVAPNGEILGFYYTCSNAEFPRGRVLSKEEALEKLFEQSPPFPEFVGFTDSEMKPHIYLEYHLGSTYYMDAITGECCTEDGKFYQEPEKAEYYTDVSGHKYEKEIRELFKYGVQLGEDGLLRPDDPITVNEFFDLCRAGKAEEYFYTDDIYDRVETTDPETGKIKNRENPKNNEPLTYSGLARLFVRRYTDKEHKPALNGNYRQPYKNVTKDNPDYAYIAIAKKQGYISKGNEFDYNKTMTRGECIKIIYDYIASDGEEKELYEIFKI